MDTTLPIIYRGYYLNDPDLRFDAGVGSAKGAQGSIVDSIDISDVDIVQFLEKRALEDGMDAGDVFQGARRVRMTGTIYGKTRPLFYDEMRDFMAATNAVLAQRDSPADKGYVPLYWSIPTNDSNFEDEGFIIDQTVYALPRLRHVAIERDSHGEGVRSNAGLAMTWSATFLMKDPIIYGRSPVTVVTTANASGTWTNRGDYIARLDAVFNVGSASGSITIAAGGATIVITVPSSSGNRIIRYDGSEKLLTFEENGVEAIRMDLLGLDSEGAHPIIPPGDSVYSVAFTSVTPTTGSQVSFTESYA